MDSLSASLVVPIIFTVVYVWPLVLWLHCVKRQRERPPRQMHHFNDKTVLLVIAHPDDECMFFAPTLLNLRRIPCRILVACVTSGGYKHSTKVREEEMFNSCRLLGIPKEDVFVLNDPRFPDHPTISWDQDHVISLLDFILVHRSVDLVFTFDQLGVSGHANHRSIHHCFCQLLQQQRVPKHTRLYVLDTVPLPRKYSGIFAFLLLYFQYGQSDKLCFISSPYDVLLSCRAMSMHRSQLVWFRLLYLLYSRYMFINEFTPLK